MLLKKIYEEETALRGTVNRGSRNVINVLVERGPDMMFEDAQGETKLNVAKELNKEDMVSLLQQPSYAT